MADAIATFNAKRGAPIALRLALAGGRVLERDEPECGGLAVVGVPPELFAKV